MSLQTQLDALEAAGLIRLAGSMPDVEYLFRHALVQETAYATLLRQTRQELHRAVAETMEGLRSGDAADLAATLAHHYEQANAPDRAAAYLRLAGDQAARVYANAEAIRLYENALRLLPACSDPAITAGEGALREGLGDVLAHVGRLAEARAQYAAAEAALPEGNGIGRATLLRKAGRTWDDQQEVDQALRAFAAAERALGARPEAEDADWYREWTYVQIGRMGALYWAGRWQEIAALAEQARPVLERFGTPALRAQFLDRYVGLAVQRERYRFSDEVMDLTRDMLAAAQEAGDAREIVNAQFSLGFGHVWRRELEEAEACLQAAQQIAEGIGSIRYRVWALTYLAVLRRFRGDPPAARAHAERSLKIAAAGDSALLLPWIGMAHGNLAWIAGREGDWAAAEAASRTALEIWGRLNLEFPLFWIAAWPLAAALLRGENRLSEAIALAERMLLPSQQRQPEALESALRAAIQAWAAGEADAARAGLAAAMEQAWALGYV